MKIQHDISNAKSARFQPARTDRKGALYGYNASLRRSLAAHGRILYDACGDGPGGFVLMGLVAAHVVVVVDEADFHHDGGHGRVAQDKEARPLFQPPCRAG